MKTKLMSRMRIDLYIYSALFFLPMLKMKKIGIKVVYFRHEFDAMAKFVLWSLMEVIASV